MARLRHVAMLCSDPKVTAEFYSKLFDLKEVARTETGVFYLSDGEINIALIPHRSGSSGPIGINHIGFEVDSIEGFQNKMKDVNLEQPLTKPNIPGSFFEYKMKDPDNNPVDVSEEGEGWDR